MATSQRKHVDLKTKARSIREQLRDSASGPLFVAVEVVALSESWDKYAAEAGGLTCTQWLRAEIHPDQGIGWYKARARAYEAFGKAVASRLHHEAAVWAVNNVPDTYIEKLKFAICTLYRDNGSMYVTVGQVRKIGRAIMGLRESLKPITRACATCEELEARIERLEEQVRGLGAEPVK